MKKGILGTVLQQLAAIWLGGLLLIFCIMMLQSDEKIYYLPEFSGPKTLLFAGIVLAVAAIFLVASNRQTHQTQWRIARGALLALLATTVVCLQFAFAFYATTPIGWDVGSIYAMAVHSEMSGAAINYLVGYPNNFLLLYLFRAVTMLGGMFEGLNLWVLLNACNIVVVDAMLCITAVLSAKVFHAGAGFVAALLGMLLIGCSPWILVPYSDLLGALTLAMLLSCMVLWFRAATLGRKLFWAGAIAALAWMAYNVKASVLVALIAAISTLVLRVSQKSAAISPKAAWSSAALLLVLFAVLQVGWTAHYRGRFTPEQQAVLPRSCTEYFFLTGLSSGSGMYGIFSPAIVSFIDSFPDAQERRVESIKRATSTIEEMGLKELARLYWRKVAWSSIDATFFTAERVIFTPERRRPRLACATKCKTLLTVARSCTKAGFVTFYRVYG